MEVIGVNQDIDDCRLPICLSWAPPSGLEEVAVPFRKMILNGKTQTLPQVQRAEPTRSLLDPSAIHPLPRMVLTWASIPWQCLEELTGLTSAELRIEQTKAQLIFASSRSAIYLSPSLQIWDLARSRIRAL